MVKLITKACLRIRMWWYYHWLDALLLGFMFLVGLSCVAAIYHDMTKVCVC